MEETVIAAVDWLRLGVEAFGAIVIAVGLVAAAVTFVRRHRRDSHRAQLLPLARDG